MMATSEQMITGFYIALFNRAPEPFELNYWLRHLGGGNDLVSYNALTCEWTAYPHFSKTFGFMNNQEFVENVFFNISGADCDNECLSDWINDLNNGLARSSFLAALVYSLLNLNTDQPSGLSEHQLTIAKQHRQNLLNRIEKALHYTHFYTQALKNME